jgi:hypothetical protein
MLLSEVLENSEEKKKVVFIAESLCGTLEGWL